MTNPFDKITDQFSEEQRLKRIDEKTDKLFTPKPFRLRMQGLASIVSFFRYIFQSLSTVTEFLAIYIVLSLTLSPIFAAIWTGLLVTFIEVVKALSSNELVKAWTNWAAVILCIASLASIGLSFFGGYNAPSYIMQPKQIAVHRIDTDSIEQYYAAQLAANKAEKEELIALNSRDNGTRVSSTVADAQNDIAEERKTIQEARASAMAYAMQMNATFEQQRKIEQAKADKEYQNKIDRQGMVWGCIALVNEFMYLLCFVFLGWYYRRADQEKKAQKRLETDKTEQQTVIRSRQEVSKGVDNSSELLVAEQKRTIGFRQQPKERNCMVCGTDISHKRKDATVCSASCRTKKYNILNNKTK